MEQAGIPLYEVSNFAQPGFECQHNLLYWQGDDYIGIGESAHGRLKINGKYCAFLHPHQMEVLTPFERAEELVIMGLRLQKGIDKAHFKEISGLDFDSFVDQKKLKQMIEQGLLIDSSSHLQATNQGFLLLDKIILELCS